MEITQPTIKPIFMKLLRKVLRALNYVALFPLLATVAVCFCVLVLNAGRGVFHGVNVIYQEAVEMWYTDERSAIFVAACSALWFAIGFIYNNFIKPRLRAVRQWPLN